MAIVRSNGMENARKSVGMLTYRNYGGQIVVSKRITSNTSNTPAQQKGRSSFSLMTKIGADLRLLVNAGFDPQGRTSRHGMFVQLNNDLKNYLTQHPAGWETSSGIDSLPKALADPTFFGRIIAARGRINAQSEVRLDAEGYPEGQAMLSRPYREGDRVMLYCYIFYRKEGIMYDRGVLQETVLGSGDVAKLVEPDTFRISRETFPDLRPVLLMDASTYVYGVATVVVQNGSERSSACFSLMGSPDSAAEGNTVI